MASQEEFLNKIARFYFFCGPNQHYQSEKVSSLIKKVISPGAEQFDLDRFSSRGLSVDTLINSIMTSPFLSPLRVILLSDIEKLSAGAAERLKNLLPKIPPSSSLVMTSPKYDKKSKLYGPYMDRYGKPDKVHLHKFDDYEPEEVIRLATRFSRERDKSLSSDAASIMIEIYGDDIYRLENEIEKICLYIGDKPMIEKKDLAHAFGFSKIESVGELPVLIFDGKAGEALALAHRAIDSGINEIQMMFIIRNFLIGLNRAKNDGDFPKLLRAVAFNKELAYLLQRLARIYSQDFINKGLMLAFRAEYALKSARFPAPVIIDSLLLSITDLQRGNK